jgi:hypothetical protein
LTPPLEILASLPHLTVRNAQRTKGAEQVVGSGPLNVFEERVDKSR